MAEIASEPPLAAEEKVVLLKAELELVRRALRLLVRWPKMPDRASKHAEYLVWHSLEVEREIDS